MENLGKEIKDVAMVQFEGNINNWEDIRIMKNYIYKETVFKRTYTYLPIKSIEIEHCIEPKEIKFSKWTYQASCNDPLSQESVGISDEVCLTNTS